MNLELLRSFFVIVEHGSLNKAAERLHVSQSTLSRQMHTLEQEIGGRILERGASGVALTAAGHALADGMRPLLERFAVVVGEARRLARGQRSDLRIGYLLSAAPQYLQPALATLRRLHPEVKVRLLDLSPGEQLEGLRKGEIDLALIGNARSLLAREFFVRRIALLPVLVVLPETHPLAARAALSLSDLRGELFVGANEKDVPGHNQWVVQLCRRARFRPRFVLDADSLTHGLATVVTEGAVSLQPEHVRSMKVPGVVFRPLRDPIAQWELLVAWQRGKLAEPVRAILDALPSPRAPASSTAT